MSEKIHDIFCNYSFKQQHELVVNDNNYISVYFDQEKQVYILLIKNNSDKYFRLEFWINSYALKRDELQKKLEDISNIPAIERRYWLKIYYNARGLIGRNPITTEEELINDLDFMLEHTKNILDECHHLEEVKTSLDEKTTLDESVKSLNIKLQIRNLSYLLDDIHKIEKQRLKIPEYQRAYEWKEEHVRHLLNDTYDAFLKHPERDYLLGHLILVKNNDKLEIVDGQQRLVTLAILLYQLGCNFSDLLEHKFQHKKSLQYIVANQKIIINWINSIGDNSKVYLDFLKQHIVFTIQILDGKGALDLAYTFFDSANSKGKILSDFDLLKAHHLMFIPGNQENLARSHNDFWQERDDSHDTLFGVLLRRIRMWSKGNDRDSHLERYNYYEFVSAIEPEEINEDEHSFNRYMQPAMFRSWERRGDKLILLKEYPELEPEQAIPMELTQTIVGGDHFFLYARRYYGLYELLFGDDHPKNTSIDFVRHQAESITNDYLRDAFKAVLLLYFDKFGDLHLPDISACVEMLISRWRYVAASVRIEGTLTHVKSMELVPIILNSTISSHVLSQFLEKLQSWQKSNINIDKKAQLYYYNKQSEFYKNRTVYYNNIIEIFYLY